MGSSYLACLLLEVLEITQEEPNDAVIIEEVRMYVSVIRRFLEYDVRFFVDPTHQYTTAVPL